MLSDESIELLRNKQEELDKIIRENSRIRRKLKCYDWKESAKRLKLALFVEIGEFSNEVKSFKHWQLTKIINWDKVKEEIVDCLHFFLSLANHFNVEIRSEKEKIAKKISSPEEYNEMILKLFNSTSRIPEVKQEEKDHSLCFTNWFKIFETICENVFSCEKELVDFYLTKNNTNRKRQQNGY